MKRILLFFFTCLCISYSHAQTKLRDSLKLLIQKEKNDTSLVKLLNSLSYTFSTTNTDTSIQLSIKALGLARRSHYAKGEGKSLQYIGWGYFLSGNYPKAMEFFLQSLKVYEEIKDANGIGAVYNGIGTVYSEQGDYQQALKYLHKANSLLINQNGAIPANLGRVYRLLKNYDSARFYTEQALSIAYKTKDPRRMGWFLSERALLHAAMDENNLALEYFRMSIPYTAQIDDYFGLCKEYLGLADALKKTGQSDSGFHYAKMAVNIARQNKLPLRIVEASTYLSTLYKDKGNADSALFYMEVTKTANDSLFSQQKLQELKTLSFDEQLRQQEKEVAELAEKQERKNNIQYALIALGILSFIILFLLLSRSFITNTKWIEFFGVIALLIVFEFLNLLLHPFLERITNHSPVFMLLALVCIAALLVPLHHKAEKWATHKLVEKNKKIRLAAAKKTIAKLEPASTEATADKGDQTN